MKHASNPIVLVLLLVPALFSCASSRGITREDTRAALTQDALAFSSNSIREIDGLAPQLEAPFRLAIAPRIGRSQVSLNYYGRRLEDTPRVVPWTADERAIIEERLLPFVESGVVSEFVWMPSLLVDPEDEQGLLVSVRRAALREQADAVLLLHSVDTCYTDANLLAILDLTIVAGLFVPGHAIHATSAMGALLVDTRNEYLYLTAVADAEVKKGAAAFKIEKRSHDAGRAARRQALTHLTTQVESRAQHLLHTVSHTGRKDPGQECRTKSGKLALQVPCRP